MASDWSQFQCRETVEEILTSKGCVFSLTLSHFDIANKHLTKEITPKVEIK